jgi:hypothetical protein
MIIITAATVVLVLVASGYALQVLMLQRAAAEFDTVQNSILTFDDALRDIAWDRAGSRSIRFTTNYGNMRLINASKNFQIEATGISGNSAFNYQFSTAVIKYQMPYGYGAVASVGPSGYILGDAITVVSRLNESLAQAVVEQTPEMTSITLNYRVRVNYEGSVEILQPSRMTVHYYDIYVIRVKCDNLAIQSGDFDLICKNVGLQTVSYGMYKVDSNDPYVSVGPDTFHLGLSSGANVIFNLIIADVRVST